MADGSARMDSTLGLLVMKLLKIAWCTRKHRSGAFDVREANHRNCRSERLAAVVHRNGNDLLICAKSTDLSSYCRSPVERRSPTGSVASTQSQSQLTPSRQLSDGEKLKKVILELVDTERSYVKNLNSLLENYLEPLKNASFLSSAEVHALFGNIREIVAFQRLFLQALQEAIDMETAFGRFEHPYEFKNVLFSIGSAFLYYASQFKLYSSFCASHSKAQKVLHPSEGNQALQEFLLSRNPRQQHSATLESYLIKPIQRILKYPLLLQQLKTLTDPASDEHRHLYEALKVMEKVAEHINEMQRIHEEYGAIFDHLFRQHQKSSKQDPQPIDLSPGDLLYYGGVEWLNISDFLGKIKKGLELHAMCFVFKTAVVFLCKERLRQKKKLMGGSGKNSSSEVEIIRYQVLIPVTEVQVRASSMKDMDSHFLWELIHLKSQLQRRSEKVYHLSNSTSEFRNAFLKTIRQIIRESVRNMSIPANKPGSSSGSSGSAGGGGGGSSSGSGRMSTSTLQPSRSGGGKKRTPSRNQSATLQRHSAGTIDYDNLESYDNVPDSQQDCYQNSFRTRSKTMSDAMDELSDSTTKSDCGKDEFGTRSEGEEELVEKKRASLGRTPNHLSLSTTSTLSTASTGSQARLILASNQPAHYQPSKGLGSPVWKPRENFVPSSGSTQNVSGNVSGSSTSLSSKGGKGESMTLPRPGSAEETVPLLSATTPNAQMTKVLPGYPYCFYRSSAKERIPTKLCSHGHSGTQLVATKPCKATAFSRCNGYVVPNSTVKGIALNNASKSHTNYMATKNLSQRCQTHRSIPKSDTMLKEPNSSTNSYASPNGMIGAEYKLSDVRGKPLFSGNQLSKACHSQEDSPDYDMPSPSINVNRQLKFSNIPLYSNSRQIRTPLIPRAQVSPRLNDQTEANTKEKNFPRANKISAYTRSQRYRGMPAFPLDTADGRISSANFNLGGTTITLDNLLQQLRALS